MSPLLIVALAVLGHLQLSQASVCDSGWGFYGDSCYKLFTDKRTFDSSGETCTTIHNALLTSILDEDEMAFAQALIDADGEGQRTWLGLRVFNIGVSEYWVDTRDDLTTPYRPWREVLDLSAGCSVVKSNEWVVEECLNKANYLCRKLVECPDGQVINSDDGECEEVCPTEEPCVAPLVRLPDGSCGCPVCNCQDPCPADWSFYLDSCYQVFTDRDTFDGSGEYCTVNHTALLTSILSQEEMDFVMGLVSNAGENRAWVGARKFAGSVDPVNVDVRVQTAYNGWASPLAFNDDGCSIAKTGEMELTDCYDNAAFVCRYDFP